MSFDYPRVLFILLLFVVFIPLVIIRYKGSREKAALFAAAAPPARREPLLRELRLRIILADILFLFFLGFLTVALAGPRWGIRIVNDYRRGVDFVLAFDLSRSMNVRDCSPYRSGEQEGISRLECGMEIAREFASSLGDIRLGTVIGKSRGILAVPLTYDSETVLSFLEVLDSQVVTGTGTDLESLIDAGIGAFQDFIPRRRGIILFSDGEYHSGSLQRAVEKTRRAGITLCVVGLGSDSGGPVPVEKGLNAPDGFLLDASGKRVISERQIDTLRNGAENSGGVFIDGNREDAAAALIGYANSLSAESMLHRQRREANPRWRLFILAAIVCLGVVRLLGFSRRTRKRSVFPALFCIFLFTSCANPQGRLLIMEANFLNTRGYYTEAIASYLRALEYEESAPYAEFGLASVFFAMEEEEAALDRYNEAEKLLELKRDEHPELMYRIHYNLGIIHFANGDYDEAVIEFREALRFDGSRIEAKRNLELSLLTSARSSSPQTISSSETEGGRQGSSRGSSVLFEYLKEKEQDQWKSREWSVESVYSGPDY